MADSLEEPLYLMLLKHIQDMERVTGEGSRSRL